MIRFSMIYMGSESFEIKYFIVIYFLQVVIGGTLDKHTFVVILQPTGEKTIYMKKKKKNSKNKKKNKKNKKKN